MYWNAWGFSSFVDSSNLTSTLDNKLIDGRQDDLGAALLWAEAVSNAFELHVDNMRVIYQDMMNGQYGSGEEGQRNYADDVYGMFGSIEVQKRQEFDQWAFDKGLIRG